jgi:hypothetical protein
MSKFGNAAPTPVGGADGEKDKAPSKGTKFHQTVADHAKTAHHHLKQAHAAAGNNPGQARHHINQAGLAVSALHKSAKEAANANGLQDDSSEYSAHGDAYQGD